MRQQRASNTGRGPDGTIAGGRARSASPHDTRGQCPSRDDALVRAEGSCPPASLTGCRRPGDKTTARYHWRSYRICVKRTRMRASTEQSVTGRPQGRHQRVSGF
ncbi:hypothetical protein EVAR_97814_1 [Eumeta japonica]|uniref:Uncharacterized protein n=1 Tax=Eumeta variegata TaxID=151549 RepID=A0A4C1XE10_EUMVA|nr:hypothetical protein EVAR_97814_1 [Eumeta japonica]